MANQYSIEAGWQTAKKLCDALGITFPVRRLVIECDVEGVTTVYAVGFLKDKDANLVRDVLSTANAEGSIRIEPVADVIVDDCGNVTVKK